MIKKLLKKLYETTDYVDLKDDQYSLKSKYKIGKIELLNNYAQLKLLQNSVQKIFIEFDKLNGAYNNDTVLVQVLFNPKGKTKAKVLEVLQRSDENILCYVKEQELFTVKESVLIDCDNVNNQNGDLVIFKNGKITQKIGTVYDDLIDEKVSLYLYNEIDRLKPYSADIKEAVSNNRKDLRDLNFCTIDPVGAKDFDDAVYYDEKNKELYVAIADVSAYVKEESELDLEARKRAFSIYLPHKVLPMLPFELSNNLCSLVPNEDRLAYVFKMKLDTKSFSVSSSELFEATINSKRRYTYEEIDEILEQNDKENYFVRFFNITSKYRNKRLKNGYDFRNEQIRQELDEDHKLVGTSTEESTPSHSLIEECMLLANQEAAKKLKTTGIFRVHEEPTNNKISKLIDDVNSLGIKASLKSDIHSTILSIQQKAQNVGLEKEVDELIIQSQQQARYDFKKLPHFGLGFNDYSHFTSPIRRYADLVLHRLLKGSKIPKDIEQICESISETERSIANLVWDFEDRKYARWAQRNLNKTFNAGIVDTQKHIAVLEDTDFKGARVQIENYSGEKLFTKIRVKLKSSDPVSKKISAVITE